MSVAEYLTAYGLVVLHANKMDEYKKLAQLRKDLSCFVVREYENLSLLLGCFNERFRDKRNVKKDFDFSVPFEIKNEKESFFLEKFGFSRDSNGLFRKNLNRTDVAYLTGGWLEEYCFNIVQDLRE